MSRTSAFRHVTVPSTPLTRRTVLSGLAAVTVGGCVSAGRTPQQTATDWPMLGGDPGRTGYAPEADPPRTEPTVAWERTPDPASGRSPIVADGTCYYQTSDRLYVLDPATGEGTAVGTFGWFEGTGTPAFARTEAYDDGTYVVPYGDQVGGYAAEAGTWPAELSDNGRHRRRWLTGGETLGSFRNLVFDTIPGVGTSPVPVDNSVVFVHGDGADAVTAVDADTGREQWTQSLAGSSDPNDSTRRNAEGFAADPETGRVVVRFTAIPASTGGISAFDLPDGTHRWTSEIGAGEGPIAVDDDQVFASVAVEDRENGTGFRLVALSLSDGEPLWERSLSSAYHLGLAVDESHCYLLGRGPEPSEGSSASGDRPLAVSALDRETGAVVWSKQAGIASDFGWGQPTQHPTVAGDVLLAPGGEAIYAFDAGSGDRLWTFQRTVGTSGGSTTTRRPMTPVVPVGDKLIAAMTLGLYGLGER